MPGSSSQRDTFVIRIWHDTLGEDDHAREWRGWIQHVPSGESRYVQDMAGIVEFIEKRAGKLEDDESSPAPLE